MSRVIRLPPGSLPPALAKQLGKRKGGERQPRRSHSYERSESAKERDPDGMNEGERRYADVVLEGRRRVGELRAWRFEPFSIRIAPRTHYRPDFLLWLCSGQLELHEVKGFWEEDARIKIKVAAVLMPWFRFVAVYEKPRGVWRYEEFPTS